MNINDLFRTRRNFLGGITAGTLGAAALMKPGVFADHLAQTPRQTEGPFYPDRMPLDTDNDLLVINDSITPAVGEVTYLSGRILDRHGEPIRNAVVEIWQVDNNAAYLHTRSDNHSRRDANFQGFGRCLTGSTGEYAFRTVKPVPYPGRSAPHIHFAVKVKGQERFTTQCYIKGYPGNERDGVLRDIRDARARELLMVDFAPVRQARIGELAARFDIVLGFTAAG
ncbi:MAG TPA: protocatechuate 3,4-dioxygenase [Blastocatellia bacterium]|nr:protocatechuate 3,4-dioxygenase [Blastocatellia bacterium]